MELLLKVISPTGQISLLPLENGRIELTAVPGARYQLILDSPEAPVRPRVMRLVDDLVIDGLPSGEEIQLTAFFTACDEATCRFEVYLDDDPVASALITPGSEPVAAITGGGFIMAEPGAPSAALPTPPEAEPAPIMRPIMAGAAGLLVIGAATGAGGGGSSDTTAPSAPAVASDTAVNTRFPSVAGSAEPSSQVTVILTTAAGDRTSYATQAADDGSWSIDTATATPQSGGLPTAGYPDGSTVTVEVLARDAAGNLSPLSRGSLQIDASPPGAPTLSVENASNGDPNPRLNATDLADGLTITGTAEAGSTITLTLADIGLQQQTTAGADGRFATTLGGPSGLALADGEFTLTARASDAAGNTGTESSASFSVDATLSDIRAEFGEIVDDRAPRVGELPEGASSNDRTPALRGALAGSLADDEQLLVLLDGVVLGAATTQPGSWEFTVPTPLSEGEHVFSLRLVDDAGNAQTPGSATPRALTIDTTPPDAQPVISAVLDDTTPVAVRIPNGGTTNDPTPLIRISVSELLEPGETILVQRTSAGALLNLGAATRVDGDVTGLAYELVDTTAPAGASVAYRASVVDAAGLSSPISPIYAIELASPTATGDIG